MVFRSADGSLAGGQFFCLWVVLMDWSGCFARGRICEVGFVKAAVSRRRLACSGLFAKEPGDSFVVRRDRAWPGSWQVRAIHRLRVGFLRLHVSG